MDQDTTTTSESTGSHFRETPDPSEYRASQPRRLLYNESRFTGALTDDLYMQNSMATILTANNVALESSVAGVVIAEKVEAKSSACLFLVAGEVNGDVRPLFSTAAAMVVAGSVLLGWALWGRVAMRRNHR